MADLLEQQDTGEESFPLPEQSLTVPRGTISSRPKFDPALYRADTAPEITVLPKEAADSPFASELSTGVNSLPEDQKFDTAVRLGSGDIKNALVNYKGMSPEKAADVVKYAKQQQVSYSGAEIAHEEFKVDEEARKIFDEFNSKNDDGTLRYPGTVAWLKDPVKMASTRDDLKALKELEDTIRYKRTKEEGFAPWAGRVLGTGGLELVKGMLGAIPAQYEAIMSQTDARYVREARLGRKLTPEENKVYDDENRAPEWLQNFFGFRNYLEKRLEDIRPTPSETPVDAYKRAGFLEGLKALPGYSLEAFSSTISAIGLGYITKNPALGLGLLAAMSGGMGYDEAVDEGKTPEQASTQAFLYAGSEALFEATGTFGILKNVEKLAKRDLKTLLDFGARAYVRGGFSEGLTQLAQQSADVYTGDKKGFENLGSNVLNATLAGGFGDAFVAVPAGLSHNLMAGNSIARAQTESENFDQLRTQVASTKLQVRNPESLAELISAQFQEAGRPEIAFVDAEKVAALFQGDLNEYYKFAESVGVTPQEAEAAIKGGADLQISSPLLLAKYPNTVAQALKDDLRFTPGGFSNNEAKIAQDEAKQVLNQMADQLKEVGNEAELPRQVQKIREGLLEFKGEKGQKFSAKDVDSMLLLVMARAKISAGQRGISVSEFFDQWGLKLDAKARVRKNATGSWEIVPEGSASPQERLAANKKGQKEFLLQQARQAGLDSVDQATPQQVETWTKEYGFKNPLYQDELAGSQSFPRGALQIQKGNTVISLFESADYSTFLHEAGHLFVADLTDIVASGLGGEQAAKDLKTLRDYAGATSDAKLTVEQEEKLARGFEAYLREGKAPSVGLAGAFFRFRAWLTALYRTISKLDVKINDEVRQVFDRLLASEQDIAASRAFYSERQSILDFIDGEEKKVAELKEKKLATERTEEDKQASAYLRAYLRAIGGIAAVREEVSKMAKQMPLWKAIDKGQVQGIEIFSAYSAIGEEAATLLSEKFPGLLNEQSSLTFEALAAEFGFQTAGELGNAMFNTPTFNQVVEKMTQDTVALQEQIIRTDLAKQKVTEGDGALHSDASLAYLVAETQLLRERAARETSTRPSRVSSEAYKFAAIDYLDRLKVTRATSPNAFIRAEQRLAREVFRAAKSANWAEASRLRDKQLLQHVLVRESLNAQSERQAIERRYSKTKINSLLKNTEAAYRPAIQAILANYGFIDLPVGLKDKAFDLKKIGQLDEDGGLDTLIPDWVKNSEQVGDYKDLTWARLKELDFAVKSLAGYGRSALLSLKASEEKTVAEFVDKSVGLMNSLADKKIAQRSQGFAYPAMKFADGIKAGVQMTQYAAETADGFEFLKTGEAGPMRRLYQRMVDAQLEQQTMMEKTLKLAEPHWKVLYEAANRIKKERKAAYFDVEGLPMPESMRLASKGQWTPEMLISALLNLGNQGNIEALKNGYGFREGFEEAISKNFTAEELKAVQGIWDSIESLWPRLAAEHLKIYNVELEKVEAKPTVLIAKDKTGVSLKGGYYPLIFDHEINARAGQFNEEDLMKNQASAVFRKTKPQDGMTISRIGSSLPPNLSLGVWSKHIEDTTRYITHAAVIRDFNRVTVNENWREAFVRKMGNASYESLRDWLKYQAVPRRLPTSAAVRFVDKGADWLRSRATISMLGLKLKTGLMQRTALINAAVALGGGDHSGWYWIGQAYKSMGTRGLGTSLLGAGNTEAFKQITDSSDLMRLREENRDRDITDAVSKIRPGAKVYRIFNKEFTLRDIQDLAFWWIKVNDRAVTAIVWLGGYLKYAQTLAGPELTPDQKHKAAAAYADKIVSETQPSSLKAELSDFGRQEGWVRFFTAFMTWSFKYGNRLLFMNRAWQEGAISNRQYFSHVFQEVFLEPATRVALYGAMVGTAPEWWQFLMAPIENLFSWIPILRDVPRNLSYGGEVFDLNRAVPAAEGVKRAGKITKSSADIAAGDGDFWEFSKDLGRLTAFTLGVPVDNVVRDISQMYDRIAGEESEQETERRGVR